VHEVLERADPADEAALGELVATRAARWSPDLDVPLLLSALDAALTTPLGPLADDRTLREVGQRERLSELAFELPLSGGDEPCGAEVLLSSLVPLWREHVPTGCCPATPTRWPAWLPRRCAAT
jgi:exodeoxyribonuclease V beta subunit